MVEEGAPAVDAEGDAEATEDLLKGAALRIGAVEHGDAAVGLARADEAADLLACPEGLEVARHGLVYLDGLALLLLGEDGLGDLIFVLSDDAARCRYDGLGGAIVTLELEDACPSEGLLKAQDVFEVRPAEGVDALGVVADDEDLALLLHQLLGYHVLGEVGILVLVDQQVVDALLPLAQHVGVLAEEDIDLQQ